MVATIPGAVPAVVATIPVPVPPPEAATVVRGDCRSRRGGRGRACLAGHCGGSSSDAAEECPRCQYAGCGFGSPAHVHCTFPFGGRTRSGRARRLRYPPDLKGKRGGSSPAAVGALLACSGWLLRASTHPRCALYLLISPCRPISRQTTDSLRPIEAAMSLFDARREAAGDFLLPGQGEFARRALPPIQLARRQSATLLLSRLTWSFFVYSLQAGTGTSFSVSFTDTGNVAETASVGVTKCGRLLAVQRPGEGCCMTAVRSARLAFRTWPPHTWWKLAMLTAKPFSSRSR